MLKPKIAFISSLMTITFLLAPSACTTIKSITKDDKVACGQIDWYGLGETDGSQGLTMDQLKKHQAKCDVLNGEWETTYINGRNSGLVEFCDAENAFELGRMNVAYMYVCPSTMEPEFLSAYRKGQETSQLETKTEELNLKIDQLYTRLTEIDDDSEKIELNEELSSLKKQRAQVDRQLNQISRQ
jgi:hypothetical protein